jgi:signal transduction histidine kinase/CheY-like chemotaxis protein/ligand-binding sensor domain-containing protein
VWLGALLGACLSLPALAVETGRPLADYLVEPWSTTRRLPEETVASIMQSPDGYLWLSTANGMLRLTGLTSFSLPWSVEQPMDRTVRMAALDGRGTTWMLTSRTGVLRLTAAGPGPAIDGVPERVTTLEPKTIVALNIGAVQPLPDGVRIVAQSGIFELTSATRPGAPPPPVAKFPSKPLAAAAGPGGDVWLAGTDRQLWRWTPTSGWLSIAPLPSGVPVRMLATADRLWLRGQGWVAKWEKGRWHTSAIQSDFYQTSLYEPMLEDRQGVLWLGGRGQIARFTGNILETRQLGTIHEETSVTSLYEDREGVIWIGDQVGRLYRLRGAAVINYGLAEGLVGDIINSIYQEPNGDYWIYSLNKGLTRWSAGGFQSYPLALPGNVWQVERDRRSRDLLLAGNSRLYRLAGRRAEAVEDPLHQPHGRILGWWQYPEGRGVLLARSTGVFRQDSLTAFDDSRVVSRQSNVRHLTGTAEGMVWGTDGQNLLEWSPSGELIQRPPGLAEGTELHALFWDTPSRLLWVGTATGLITWDPARRLWGTLGLTSDSVFAIQRDPQGQLWLGTRNGLVSIDAAAWLQGRREPSARLMREDGLRSLNFGMVRSQGSVPLADGRLLFGSMRGVTLIDGRRLAPPRFPPTVTIDRITVEDRVVPLQKNLQLSAGTTRVQVHFDAFSVSLPKLIAVQYRLDGLDHDWQPKTEEREAQYANLGPGDYRFRVRAAGAAGPVGPEATIQWTIAPRYYETLWFRALALGLLLSAIVWWVKQRGARLQRSNEELSLRVAERTQQLEAAKLAAEAGGRAKAEFLATMSHELRTPMNGVLGLAQLLEQTPLDAPQLQLLGTLRSSAEALLTIVNDILDLSKIEAGKLEVERIPVQVTRVVRDVVDLVGPLAQAKGLSLQLTSEGPSLPWIEGDPARLRQVLLNLLGNAIKFTAQGGVEVKLQWQPGQLQVAVIDTGIGIPAEKLPLLFQQFVQLDSSTTRLHGGTGLGLAIASRLAEAMGGSISCLSTPGEGSQFILTLPAVAAAAPPVEADRRTGSTQLLNLRVLVAEDNAVNQMVIQGMLKRFGIDAVLAVNGAEALARAQQEAFDLVLMDCQMPVMDGYEATRQMRALMGAAAPAVVALTAHSLDTDREACLAAGMTGYLSKPLRADELLRLLEAHQASRPVAKPTATEPTPSA